MDTTTTDHRPDATSRAEVIRIQGAREHNLDDLDLEIPTRCITAVTGVSGSGKSSLVFATLAAESGRQVNELFPAFVQHRLPRHQRADVDRIDGLPPAVVIDQRRLGGNARSTVGTATEIHTRLRLLYSRAGSPFVGYSPVFSFNDPSGMCDRCEGLGTVTDIDLDLLFDRDRSLNEGAIRFPTFAPGTYRWKRYVTSGLFDNDKPLRAYTDDEVDLLLHATDIKPPAPLEGWPPTGTYEGVLPRFRRSYLHRDPTKVPRHLAPLVEELVSEMPCPACDGTRLNETARRPTVDGYRITELAAMQIDHLLPIVRGFALGELTPLRDGLVERLESLVAVGLGYLTLSRETPTLSGGESQRVKLVRHLGSSLTGLLYVLDEPADGLHPHDVARLIELLRHLRDAGNTVVIVEHDPQVIASADHVIELGPGAGAAGGRLVHQGDVASLRRADTATGRSLAGRLTLRTAREPQRWLLETPIRANNVDVHLRLPRGTLTVVTGVAGSGKSTLLRAAFPPNAEGVTHLGRSRCSSNRRSTLASYTGLLDVIRDRFAEASGAEPGLFSANAAGACPECKGVGTITTDLAFLDAVTTVCEACRGSRYRPEALEHRWKDRSIHEVLDLTIVEALQLLAEPAITPPLERLASVGLGYLTLARSLASLSGGERQRLELAGALVRPQPVYILDEPTGGLHEQDVAGLLGLLDDLVEQGSSVIVIEHHLQVVASADWIIDLGPGAGQEGGRLVFEGPPHELVDHPTSTTAMHLRQSLSPREPRHGGEEEPIVG